MARNIKGKREISAVVGGVLLVIFFAAFVVLLNMNRPRSGGQEAAEPAVVVENTAVNDASVVSVEESRITVEIDGRRASYELAGEVTVSIFDPSGETDFREGALSDVTSGSRVNLILNKDNDVTSITVIS